MKSSRKAESYIDNDRQGPALTLCQATFSVDFPRRSVEGDTSALPTRLAPPSLGAKSLQTFSAKDAHAGTGVDLQHSASMLLKIPRMLLTIRLRRPAADDDDQVSPPQPYRRAECLSLSAGFVCLMIAHRSNLNRFSEDLRGAATRHLPEPKSLRIIETTAGRRSSRFGFGTG
jgi:hypothetical protein